MQAAGQQREAHRFTRSGSSSSLCFRPSVGSAFRAPRRAGMPSTWTVGWEGFRTPRPPTAALSPHTPRASPAGLT